MSEVSFHIRQAFAKLFNQLSLVLAAIALPLFFADLITYSQKTFIYTCGHLIKSTFIATLPLVVLPFVIRSFMEIRTLGTYIILLILTMVMFSNFVAVILAYVFGTVFIPYIGSANVAGITYSKDFIESLHPFDFPEIISIPQTIALGITIGLVLGHISSAKIEALINSYYEYSYSFLSKIFVYLIPFYIFATMLKMVHEIDFLILVATFGKVIGLFVAIQAIYITFLFFVGCSFDVSKTIRAIKNSLPAGVVGFSTMSSLLTLPVTLKAARINTTNSKLADVTITSTVNYHDIGECISIPTIALSIIYISYGALPDYGNYMMFAAVVSIFQFSAVSVPGGSIIIMLPLLTKYFNFTDEMSSLLITMVLCTESIGTAANVMGNNAFVIIIERINGTVEYFTKRNLHRITK